MKCAAVHRALAFRPGVEQSIIHTGQHASAAMSDVFFRDLGLPEPDVNLGAPQGATARSTRLAAIVGALDQAIAGESFDLALVYGDVDSTIGGALVCHGRGIPLAHVEAGLRSFDRSMPEEANRVTVDHLSDLLFAHSESAVGNLAAEGIRRGVHLVGNVMVDTLARLLPNVPAIQRRGFVLVTLHRPSNVDDPVRLSRIIRALILIAAEFRVFFVMHPRWSRERLYAIGSLEFLEPLGYREFVSLQRGAAVVVTDSGGVQEETSYLGVPCLTLRPNTERPITITHGTNELVTLDSLVHAVRRRASEPHNPKPIPLWDGRAGERIADIITNSAVMENAAWTA
jgi:UDP-N-acetylglucosamine 2-epimerase (non-hydrolysing)